MDYKQLLELAQNLTDTKIELNKATSTLAFLHHAFYWNDSLNQWAINLHNITPAQEKWLEEEVFGVARARNARLAAKSC